MEELRRLKEMYLRELKEYAHKDSLSASARVEIHMMTDTIKNICKIEMYEQLKEEGDFYEPGESYADGKEEVRQIMQEAMDAAQEPQMREKIRQCMEQLER